jgi:hypothetical protein
MTAFRRPALLAAAPLAAALALAAWPAAAQQAQPQPQPQPQQVRPVTPQTGVEAEVGGPGAGVGRGPVETSDELTAAESRLIREHIADARRSIRANRMRDALREVERAQTALLNSRYMLQTSRPSGGPAYADLEAALGAVDDRRPQEALAALERADAAIGDREATMTGSPRPR